jgi:hypothetical protein
VSRPAGRRPGGSARSGGARPTLDCLARWEDDGGRVAIVHLDAAFAANIRPHSFGADGRIAAHLRPRG